MLAVLGISAGVYYEAGRKGDERPPLTDGLTGKWGDMSATFNARLQKAHPLGSPAAALTASLAKQDFESQFWGIEPGVVGEARLDESNWVCRQGADLQWKVDQQGRLNALRGTYGEQGCL
jgi:hypothetical protein